jgi:hypothetical protein
MQRCHLAFCPPHRHDGSVMLKALPTSFLHLQSAIGLELGNLLEANEELEKIQPMLRPIHRAACPLGRVEGKALDSALEIGRTLTEMLPDDPFQCGFCASSFYFAGVTRP